MKPKYPWVSVTLFAAVVYCVCFCLMYIVAGITYQLFSSIPADQSRSVSAVYYGAIFTVIPFIILGLFSPVFYVRRYVVHVLAVSFLMEKGMIVFLAALIASGYPVSWYGEGFPTAGFGVLCEEFPFYCRPYVTSYMWLGTAVSFVCLYAGSRLGVRLKQASSR